MKNTGQGWKETRGNGKGEGKGVKNDGNNKGRGGRGGRNQTRKLVNKGVDRRRQRQNKKHG